SEWASSLLLMEDGAVRFMPDFTVSVVSVVGVVLLAIPSEDFPGVVGVALSSLSSNLLWLVAGDISCDTENKCRASIAISHIDNIGRNKKATTKLPKMAIWTTGPSAS